MSYFTIALLIIGALILIFGIFTAVGGFLAIRRQKAAPFLNYFDSCYDRDHLQHSSLAEAEDWQDYQNSRFTPFRLREPGPSERDIRHRDNARRNPESD